MPIKYIGRTTDFKGKSLWEILGNLKNFGVGRIVVRSMFERYPEPSYMKIMKVETLPNEEVRKVKVWVERTFRGRKYPKLVEMCSTTYKTDYRLIPKTEEAAYCKYDGPLITEKILPQTVKFPPLLKELILRDQLASGKEVTDEPKLSLKYRLDNASRLAVNNEKPTVEVTVGLGTPVSPSLYKGIKL